MTKKKLFGTDGIRGRVEEWPLTKEVVFYLGSAMGRYLQGRGKVLIGKDTRASCDQLEKILAAGLNSVGLKVYSAGVIPTPGLAYLTRKTRMSIGAMISASHNLASDNGIKLFSRQGFKLPDEEEEKIERMIQENLGQSQLPRISGGHCAHLNKKETEGRYIDFLKQTVKKFNFRGIKLVIDCANGAASGIGKKLFGSELGMEVTCIHSNPDGHNINLNCGSLHPHHVAKAVVAKGADMGFCFDGDGDRLIICDEQGRILDGDYIMAMLAINMLKQGKLSGQTLVTTIMSNFGLDKAMQEAGIKLIKTKVGDRYVLEQMLSNGFALGGEQSGHIIFLEQTTTGDGLITALNVLALLRQSGKTLSSLAQCLQKYPQVLLNIKVKEKIPLEDLPSVQDLIQETEEELRSDGRIVVRYSGTEPLARVMIEGRNEANIRRMAEDIIQEIKRSTGG